MITVLTEKGSAAKEFARALGGMTGTYAGKQYQIVAASGHLLELPSGPDMMVKDKSLAPRFKAWDLEAMPWDTGQLTWERVPLRGSSAKLATIKRAVAASDTVYLAGDLDPSGEGGGISWEILDYIGMSHGKKYFRMKFLDQSDKSIQEAFANPVPIASMETHDEYRMFDLRSKVDYALGLQGTRAVTTVSGVPHGHVIRMGRLKSAMVVMVGDQLAARAAYKRTVSYERRFRDEHGVVYKEAGARTYEKKSDVPSSFHASEVVLDSRTMKSTAPPKLLDLGGIGSLLGPKGLRSSTVLSTYQAMYTDQVVSYPRTEDRTVTPEQFKEMLPYTDRIARLVGVDPAKLTHRTPRRTHVKPQGAHGANRPGVKVPSSLEGLDARYGTGARQIYELLAKSWLSILAEDYEYEQQKGHLKDYPDFKGTANVPKKLGFKGIFDQDAESDDDGADEDSNAKGLGSSAEPIIFDVIPPKPAKPTQRWILARLVKMGIGTGATRLSTYRDVTSSRSKDPLMADKRGVISMKPAGETAYLLLPGTHLGSLDMTAEVFADMKRAAAGEMTTEQALDKVAQWVRDDIETLRTNADRARKEGRMTDMEVEYVNTTLNGQDIRFKRTWGTGLDGKPHRFTDDEVRALSAGELIEFKALSKLGKEYTARGALGQGTYKDKDYWGFQLDTTPRVPDSWAGHTFTEDERQALEAGETIHLDDCVSRKTGKTFEVDVSYGEEEGRMKIIPHFAPRKEGVPDSWAGHSFTPDEVRDLEAGKAVIVTDCVSKAGNRFEAMVRYAEEDGRKRIVPEFKGFIPGTFLGHKITPDERRALQDGETVMLTGLRSKKGNEFDANVSFEKGEMKMHFDKR